ncbi:MAG: hypothetical protein CFH37_00497 [Alphaproteobacteria bacterium MarineAlpha9_Bin7]|nr:MAG: hypothetical protein CFH37_00497 [Alphaproteobacteria bacterium MarineAlpha9_Bin7]HIM72901.1 hypothetical protein [Alphaproteobacteria bacterium]
MTRSCIGALLGALLSFTCANAQHLDKATFLEIEAHGNTEERAILTVYLRGVLNGLEASNMELLREGRARLYCPPFEEAELTTNWLIEALLVYLKGYPLIPNTLSIATITNNMLAEQFACERQVHD